MFRMNTLAALFAVLLAYSGIAHATCTQPPSPPVYQCAGGICNTCSSGSEISLRSCSEAYYYAHINFFGPITFKYEDWHPTGVSELRWTTQPGQDYNAYTQRISTGTDCPEVERNSGCPSCSAKGSPTFGNPINVGIGSKYQDETDFAGQGAFPLQFHRYYNSAVSWGGAAGNRWTHTYSRHLVLQSGTEIK